MKRIVAIELHNFLAFYSTENKISLPKGENLLLYGENGSGKSSLCRALEVFFEQNSGPDFDLKYRNLWADRAAEATSIKVDFRDEKVSPLPDTVEFPGKMNRRWIEESRLASGFLTYRDILKTHFLEENRANLFDLVVNEILRGYKSPISGKVLSEEWADFEQEWDDFLNDIWDDPEFNSSFEKVEKEVADIITDEIERLGEVSHEFDDSLNAVLAELNPKTNDFLGFFDQNVSVELLVGDHVDRFGNPEKGTMLSYHNLNDDIELLKILRDGAIDPVVQKGAQNLLQNLTLKKPLLTAEVHYLGRFIQEHQTFLNEARLSALAICIFLAALRLKPDPKEGCKVLFLDDVIIGLDSGNRLPLLRILKEHFQDFQIYISTYDRHWFEISKRFVSKPESSFEWKCAELYSKEENRNGNRFIKPVLHASESSLARALYHFKNTHRPDFPAAVNYLRKTLEETIQENLPQKELKEQTGETQDSARLLKPLLATTKHFFERIHQPTSTVDHIREKLRTLLNPLSHFEIDTPIYQSEVQEIFELVEKLSIQFSNLKPKLKEILPPDSWVQIKFKISATENGYFRLKHKEAIYSHDSSLSNCSFRHAETFIINNGTKSSTKKLHTTVFDKYESLKDAYDKIYTFCKSGSFPQIALHPDYLDAIFVEENGTIIPLKSKLLK